MDLDTARQLLQDFELILGIAQQGIATIREFTDSTHSTVSPSQKTSSSHA